jgi:hypothetical protein
MLRINLSRFWDRIIKLDYELAYTDHSTLFLPSIWLWKAGYTGNTMK